MKILFLGYDTFCPISGYIPRDGISDVSSLTLKLQVDGVERQNGSTSLMIFPISQLIAHVSRYGDVGGGGIKLCCQKFLNLRGEGN